MHVQKITRWSDLEPYRHGWDDLAGDCVFRSWTWLSTWWKHYAEHNQLFVLLVFDDEPNPTCHPSNNCSNNSTEKKKPIAILPCYLEANFARGRILRLLGDGEVCSDYLDLLANTTDTRPATQALAHYLCENANDWDTTDFSTIGVDTPGLNQLSSKLAEIGCHVTHTANQNCWSITLPENWEAYIALQSKSHRKQIRRLKKRILDNGQATWHLVETLEQFEIGWSILTDLHQRRRNSLGEPGCFASKQWADFHYDVAKKLLEQGKLRLSWVEIAGQPVAAEYNFTSGQHTWSYQAGINPDRIDEQPGSISLIYTIQNAIAEGQQHYDLLRGDEPYKAHWRAQPQKTFDMQIVSNRSAARWRWQAYNTFYRAARFARQVTNLLS